MGTTLQHGIFLPAEGERNCYEGLAANWTALDRLIGGYNVHISNTTIHVTAADKEAWDGKADNSALTAHTGDTTIHVTSADKQAWDGHVADTTIHVTSADKQTWDGHVADTTIHVTSADKQAWNGKQDALSQTQLDAVNSGIDSTKVQQIATNTSDISSLQSGKANDNSVVHTSGNETVGGVKTFTDSMRFKSNVAEYGVTGGNIQFYLMDKNNVGLSKINQGVYSSGTSYITLQLYGKDSNNQTVTNTITYQYSGDFSKTYLFPNDNDVWLGKSGNRWSKIYGTEYYYGSNNVEFSTKFVTTDTNQTISGNKTFSSINGVEPSSLSLPSDRSARIDISSYFTNTGTEQSNSYTVPANGYIYLTLSELTNVHCFSRASGNVINYAQTFTKPSNSTGVLYVLFPVRKNDVFVATWYTTTTVSVDGAFFIPCKGNI